MKLKQIVSTLVAVSMLIGVLVVPTGAQQIYADVPQDAVYIQSLSRLTQLKIVNGYEDGTFRPGNNITRAEFSKILVSALGLEDSVTDSNISGIFTDVAPNHWANGYINLVYKKGFITGYGDGSFKPDDNINFGEALTLMLRAMGYTAADIGYHWPDSYVAKAKALGLVDGIVFDANDAITRADMVLICDRTLFAESNYQSGMTVFELLGYKEVEDVIVLATRGEDSTLSSNQIKTSSGTYKLAAANIVLLKAGDRGSMYLNDKNEVVTFYLDEQITREITVDSVIDKTVYGYENGNYVSAEIDNDMTVYWKGNKNTLSGVKSSITQGSSLVLVGYEYGAWDYAVLNNADMLGPVVVSAKPTADTLSIGTIFFREGVKVYREDKAISLTDIDVYDVIYYVEGTNTIYAYNDKETGTYDEAFPNRATVTSISLSGVTYTLGTKTAISKLDADGVFDIDDKITVLLGMNGEIVDVISSTNVNDYSSYAVVVDAYTQVSKDEENYGRSEYYTTVVNLDGKEYTYKSADDYTSFKGYVTELNFKDGLMYLESRFTVSSNAPTGYIDTTQRMIGDSYVSPEVKIIEVNADSSGVVRVARVSFNELVSMRLESNNVMYYEKDSQFGDITVLVLKNFTNNSYDYGFVSSKKDNSITVDIDGVKTTYQGTFTVEEGAPVRILAQGNKIVSLYQLNRIASATKIGAIDSSRIKVDGYIIYVADNVKIYRYKKNSTEKEMMSYDELKEDVNNIIDVSVYSDKALANGAKARVIVVTVK